MGLKGTLLATDKNNSYCEDIKDAYFKVEDVFINTNNKKAKVSVRGWMSEFARHNQGIGIFKRVFYIPMDFFAKTPCNKEQLSKKAYEYISKLPEFSGFKKQTRKYSGEVLITEEVVKQDKKDLDQLIAELKG